MGGRFKATEEITVPQCICHVGYSPGECAYVIFNTVDKFFAEKEVGIVEKDVLESLY